MAVIQKTVAAKLYILLGDINIVKTTFQCQTPDFSGFPLSSMSVYSMARSDHEQPAMMELLYATCIGTLSTKLVRIRQFRWSCMLCDGCLHKFPFNVM